jgi:hypothetical protein
MSDNPNLAKNPPIEQIRLGTQVYDIKTRKDWAENDVDNIGYIQNRTHYFYDVKGAEIEQFFQEPQDEAYAAQRAYFTAYHEFKNRYYANGDLNYRDYWYPNVSWLEEGNTYDLVIKTTGSSEPVTDTITLSRVNAADSSVVLYSERPTTSAAGKETKDGNERPDYELGWKNRVIYSFIDKNIYIEAEDRAAVAGENNFFATNGFTITITPRQKYEDVADKQETSYRATKYLDANFLPLDASSIHINSEGKLEVEDVFPNDFRVSYQFGQYLANEVVNAEKKSVKDVILDAFCKDVNPTANILPKIDEFTITPTTDTAPDENGYHELGQTVNYNYSVKFDPGVYEFGVSSIGKDYQAEATSDVTIDSHSYRFSSEETNHEELATDKFETGLRDAYYDSKSITDTYKSIGWGTGDNRYANLKSSGSLTLPNKPNHNITSTYTVKFDHVNLKNIEENRDSISLGYLPCTMFGYPIDTSKVGDVCFHKRMEWTTDANGNKIRVTPPECTKTIDAFKCDYRWFWGYTDEALPLTSWEYKEEDSLSYIQIPREWLLNQATQLNRHYKHYSKLGGFESSITTFKMKYLYFLAPKNKLNALNIEATHGSNPRYQYKYSVKIADATNNCLHDYDLWILSNTVPDMGAHTYKINPPKDLLKGATN